MEYRFERFTLDLTHQRLTCEGALLSSDPRLLRLLTLLIENAPEPIDSDTLLAALWPDTHVSHWSISRLVSDARKLFKEAGAEFPVIQTLHGRGYRLASQVQDQLQRIEVAEPNPPPPAAEAEPTPGPAHIVHPVPPSHPLSWPIRLLLLSQAVLIAILAWQLWRTPDDHLRLGEPSNPTARVLWVDDHPDNNLSERRALLNQRIAVYTTTSSHEALMLLELYDYDLVISDMGRSGDALAGLKLVKALRERQDDTPYLLYTILPSEALQRQILAHGAQGIAVDKPALYQQLAEYIPLDAKLAIKHGDSITY